jgi:hypothetical protein
VSAYALTNDYATGVAHFVRLRIPAAITKNRTGRILGLEGDVRTIIERRLRVRRFDCPLIFHRECKG